MELVELADGNFEAELASNRSANYRTSVSNTPRARLTAWT
jgi:hypothetical protein